MVIPSPDETYADIIARIQKLRDKPAREESFRQMQEAFTALSPDWNTGKNILVAGTNGKGTVAKTLETLLLFAGEKVGLYTSPHLISTTERIRSLGRDLTQDEFVKAYGAVRKIAEDLGLSHFGTLTLMMAEVFFGGRIRPQVTRAVIEVGVGGRLDPTRLVPHSVSVVTQLGLDHVELLGGSLHSIAQEKFAITDPGNLLVHAPLPEEVSSSEVAELTEHCARRVEALTFDYSVREDSGKPIWWIHTPWGHAPLSLRGKRAVENTSVALTVLSELGLAVEPLLPRLKEIAWPGRMEGLVISDRRVFLSGDHNVHGVKSLFEILQHVEYQSVLVVVGIGGNKPAEEMLEEFCKLRGARLFLTLTTFRAGALSAYGHWLDRAEAAIENPIEAFHTALRKAGEKDIVLVTGSLYLVGEIRKNIFTSEHPTSW